MKTETTAIEWADYTFNPWRGCTKVSDGCAHCYAETLSKRNPGLLGQWGKGRPRVRASEAMWRSPLKWNSEAAELGTRPRVFCASLADWLDDEVPVEWLVNLLQLIHATPHLDWLLLTKRPQNWQLRLIAAHAFAWDHGKTVRHDQAMDWLGAWAHAHVAPSNVWLGTSAEHQAAADERIPLLTSIPARIHFLSCEPLLDKIDLEKPRPGPDLGSDGSKICQPWLIRCGIDWIIAGGESGTHARPMHPAWARSLRDQCAQWGIPFLFKQWGEWLPSCQYQAGDTARFREKAQHSFSFDDHSFWVGKKNAGRQLDGRTHDEFPLSASETPSLL